MKFLSKSLNSSPNFDRPCLSSWSEFRRLFICILIDLNISQSNPSKSAYFCIKTIRDFAHYDWETSTPSLSVLRTLICLHLSYFCRNPLLHWVWSWWNAFSSAISALFIKNYTIDDARRLIRLYDLQFPIPSGTQMRFLLDHLYSPSYFNWVNLFLFLTLSSSFRLFNLPSFHL